MSDKQPRAMQIKRNTELEERICALLESGPLEPYDIAKQLEHDIVDTTNSVLDLKAKGDVLVVGNEVHVMLPSERRRLAEVVPITSKMRGPMPDST